MTGKSRIFAPFFSLFWKRVQINEKHFRKINGLFGIITGRFFHMGTDIANFPQTLGPITHCGWNKTLFFKIFNFLEKVFTFGAHIIDGNINNTSRHHTGRFVIRILAHFQESFCRTESFGHLVRNAVWRCYFFWDGKKFVKVPRYVPTSFKRPRGKTASWKTAIAANPKVRFACIRGGRPRAAGRSQSPAAGRRAFPCGQKRQEV